MRLTPGPMGNTPAFFNRTAPSAASDRASVLCATARSAAHVEHGTREFIFVFVFVFVFECVFVCVIVFIFARRAVGTPRQPPQQRPRARTRCDVCCNVARRLRPIKLAGRKHGRLRHTTTNESKSNQIKSNWPEANTAVGGHPRSGGGDAGMRARVPECASVCRPASPLSRCLRSRGGKGAGWCVSERRPRRAASGAPASTAALSDAPKKSSVGIS